MRFVQCLKKVRCLLARLFFSHDNGISYVHMKGGGSFTHVIKASEPVVSVILGLIINGIVPRPFTAVSLLPITYGVAYASTLGQLDVSTMSRELTTKAAKYGSSIILELWNHLLLF